MNYPDNENPHRTETPYSQRIHYKDNVACGMNDNPSRIELRPRSGSWPELTFEWPRQKFELEKVERFMHIAYEAGKTDQQRLIRRTLKEILGIKGL